MFDQSSQVLILHFSRDHSANMKNISYISYMYFKSTTQIQFKIQLRQGFQKK